MSRSRSHLRAGMCGLAIAVFGAGVATAGAAAPTVPGPPTISAAVAGVQNATVSFDPPASNGGAPIVAYTVTCVSTDHVYTALSSGAASPIRVGGMAVGKPYTCRVAARNVVGLGAPSVASGPVVPLVGENRARPDPPINVRAVPEAASILIQADAPPEPPAFRRVQGFRGRCTSSDGGVPGSRRIERRKLIVLHLTPGKTYTCEVRASNANGFGAYSAASNAAVPLPVPPGLGAPTISSVTAGTRSITVSFNQPPLGGGLRIFHDRATCVSSDGGVTNARTGVRSPVVVLGLSAGKTYTCTVIAHDLNGDGPRSAPSAPVVTPAS